MSKTPKPFDPEDDYGVVSPIERNCAYWQNGRHYSIDLDCVDFATGKTIATRAEMEREHNPPDEEEEEAPKPKASKPAKQKDEDVDLDAFLNGRKYPWHAVQKAVEAKYGKVPASKREAAEIITGVAPD